MRTDSNQLSHWQGKRWLVTQWVKLESWSWSTYDNKGSQTKLASTSSHFQFQGVGCIQLKTGDMGLAIGYADILDKLTTFTIQDPKWHRVKPIRVACTPKGILTSYENGKEPIVILPWKTATRKWNQKVEVEMTPTLSRLSSYPLSAAPGCRFCSGQGCRWCKTGCWLCWHPW